MSDKPTGWATAFDRLEAAIRCRRIRSAADLELVTAVSLAAVAGNEATKRAEELGADVAALRSQVRELRAAGLRPMPPVVAIHRYGDLVVLDPQGARIIATVTGVMLDGEDFKGISYRLVWFNERSLVVNWIEARLVEAADDDATRAAVAYGGMRNDR
jgi:hypothetical protein